MRRRARRRQTEAGFTLVELLISVAIMVIIISAISAALIAFLQNGKYTSERDDNSAGALLLSSYLDRDLASAGAAPTITSVGGSTTKCGGSNNVVLSWTDYSASPASPVPVPSTAYTATYTVSPDPDNTDRCILTRVYRAGASVDSTTLVTDLVNTSSNKAVTAALVTSTTSSATACSTGTKLVVVLQPYEAETATTPYTYSGCANGRQS